MEGTHLFSNAGRSQFTLRTGFLSFRKKNYPASFIFTLSPMLFNKFAGLFILFFTIIVVACPIPEEAIESDGLEVYCTYTDYSNWICLDYLTF